MHCLKGWVFVMAIYLFGIGTTALAYSEQGKIKLFGPLSNNGAQYSPYILHQPGWAGYLMYYCKNTPEFGVWRDRVWRIEQYGDGITQNNWINDQIVIEGSDNSNDDLSYSPGLVINSAGTWHMYYLTALRTEECNLHIYHASASAPGVSWVKHGEINGSNFPTGCYENPSPILMGNKLILYVSGGNGQGLYRAESTDGHTFTPFQQVSAPLNMGSGGVRFANGVYYLTYSRRSVGPFQPPNQIYLTASSDGFTFPEGQLIMMSNGSDWDGTHMWNPTLYIDGSIIRIYYAGTLGIQPWWGLNGSIGVRWYSQPIPTPRPTPVPTPLFTLNDMKPLLTNYLSPNEDPRLVVRDGKVNMIDIGFVIQ